MAEPTPFSASLYRLLDRAESLLLLFLLAGAVLFSSGVEVGYSLISIGLGGLAAIFFLMAYRPPSAREQAPGEKSNFMELMVQTIIPKVLWISCSVGATGLLLRHLQVTNNGYKEMLMIQTLVVAVALVLTAVVAMMGVPGVRKLMPIYFRALPLTLASISLLMA